MAVFQGRKFFSDTMNNDTMSNDEVVASDLPRVTLFSKLGYLVSTIESVRLPVSPFCPVHSFPSVRHVLTIQNIK